jgi:hypothetical protein
MAAGAIQDLTSADWTKQDFDGADVTFPSTASVKISTCYDDDECWLVYDYGAANEIGTTEDFDFRFRIKMTQQGSTTNTGGFTITDNATAASSDNIGANRIEIKGYKNGSNISHRLYRNGAQLAFYGATTNGIFYQHRLYRISGTLHWDMFTDGSDPDVDTPVKSYSIANAYAVRMVYALNSLANGGGGTYQTTETADVRLDPIIAITSPDISPGSDALSLTTSVPTAVNNSPIDSPANPPAGAASLTGQVSGIIVSTMVDIAPSAGAMVVVGYFPQLSTGTNTSVSPGFASMVTAGFLPIATWTANLAIIVAAGTSAILGSAPAVIANPNLSLLPGAGSASLSTVAPSITTTSGTVSIADIRTDTSNTSAELRGVGLILNEVRAVNMARRSASILVTGTYTGAPSYIQARIVDGASPTTPIIDWMTIDATPTGGEFSGSVLGVPAGGPYRVQVRFNGSTQVDEGASNWYTGLQIAFGGQSNGVQMSNEGSWPAQNTAQFIALYGRTTGLGGDIGTWDTTPRGTGIMALVDELGDKYGMPVGVISACVGGTPLTAGWDDSAASNLWKWMVNAVALAGGRPNFFYFNQGEQDVIDFVTEATYYANLLLLRNNVRTAWGNEVPILLSALGRRTGQSSAEKTRYEGIRRAQFDACRDYDQMFMAHTAMDVQLKDAVHYNATSCDDVGLRLAQAMLAMLGESGHYRGPQPVAYSLVNTTTIDVHFKLRGGPGLRDAPAAIQGWHVFNAGDAIVSATPIVPTSVTRIDAATLRLNLASAVTGTPQVTYMWGAEPALTLAYTAGLLNNTLKNEARLGLPIEPAGLIPARRSITLDLVDRAGSAQSNLSGIAWAFYERTTPDVQQTPTQQGTGAVTDATGQLVITLTDTSLKAGDTGWLVLSDSDGTAGQTPAGKGFSAPVVLA